MVFETKENWISSVEFLWLCEHSEERVKQHVKPPRGKREGLSVVPVLSGVAVGSRFLC